MGNIQHLGVIMDGNRRWAKHKNLPSIEGHKKGAETLFSLCDWCINFKIKYLSAYVFSTYNWNRTELEISNLFNLMIFILEDKIQECINNGLHITIMGDTGKLNQKIQIALSELEYKTRNGNNLFLNLAINYGGKEEILYSIKSMLKDLSKEEILYQLNEELLEKYLYTKNMPNIDLLIRTGGFQRISNFMLWQSACAEMYFTSLLWPEFSYSDFQDVLNFYDNTIINNGK